MERRYMSDPMERSCRWRREELQSREKRGVTRPGEERSYKAGRREELQGREKRGVTRPGGLGSE
jgi:hypothetical protein